MDVVSSESNDQELGLELCSLQGAVLSTGWQKGGCAVPGARLFSCPGLACYWDCPPSRLWGNSRPGVATLPGCRTSERAWWQQRSQPCPAQVQTAPG